MAQGPSHVVSGYAKYSQYQHAIPSRTSATPPDRGLILSSH